MELYRKDFTIDTLAIQLNKDYFGKLIDYFNGKLDLDNKSFEVLYSTSLYEDPSRIFKAIRIEQKLNFTIGKNIFFFLKKCNF